MNEKTLLKNSKKGMFLAQNGVQWRKLCGGLD